MRRGRTLAAIGLRRRDHDDVGDDLAELLNALRARLEIARSGADVWADQTVTGGAGPDALHGGWGADRMSGGLGDDTLDGGWGDDVIESGAGDDVIDAGWGGDLIYAFSWGGEPDPAQEGSPTMRVSLSRTMT